MAFVIDNDTKHLTSLHSDMHLWRLLERIRSPIILKKHREILLRVVSELPQNISLSVLHEMTADEAIGSLAKLLLSHISSNF